MFLLLARTSNLGAQGVGWDDSTVWWCLPDVARPSGFGRMQDGARTGDTNETLLMPAATEAHSRSMQGLSSRSQLAGVDGHDKGWG